MLDAMKLQDLVTAACSLWKTPSLTHKLFISKQGALTLRPKGLYWLGPKPVKGDQVLLCNLVCFLAIAAWQESHHGGGGGGDEILA